MAHALTVALVLPAAPARAEPPPSPVATPDLPPADAEDQRIGERLRTIFSLVEELQKARVSVRLGVVHLTGTALSEADRKKAGELARGLDGVAYVDNDLEVESGVGERIDPIATRMEKQLAALIDKLPIVGVALVAFLPFVLLAKLLASWKAPFRIITRTPLVRGIVQRVVATILVLMGLVVALQVLDVAALVGAVLGTAGVLGITLGFAFRDIAENYLASILLGIRRPFAVHDHVIVDEHEGKVVRMTMRETILMTLEGNHLRLPNALVFKAVIVNFTRNPRRRFDFVVGVAVEENLAEAQCVGVAALEALPGVLADPPAFSLVEELAASSVAMRFFGWIDQEEHDILKIRSAAIRRVKKALDEAGVEMPEPIQRLRLERRAARARKAPEEEPALATEPDLTLDRQIREDLAAEDENLLA